MMVLLGVEVDAQTRVGKDGKGKVGRKEILKLTSKDLQ